MSDENLPLEPEQTSEIPWPDVSGLSPEDALLADAHALVDAGHAEWVAEP